MILYFIDIIINVKYLYDKISNNGYYVYNISDIIASHDYYLNTDGIQIRNDKTC